MSYYIKDSFKRFELLFNYKCHLDCVEYRQNLKLILILQLFVEKGIDNCNKIKSKIIEIASKFPALEIIRWDFAVINNGISIIEFNLNFGLEHLQISANKGLRRVLQVYPR